MLAQPIKRFVVGRIKYLTNRISFSTFHLNGFERLSTTGSFLQDYLASFIEKSYFTRLFDNTNLKRIGHEYDPVISFLYIKFSFWFGLWNHHQTLDTGEFLISCSGDADNFFIHHLQPDVFGTVGRIRHHRNDYSIGLFLIK